MKVEISAIEKINNEWSSTSVHETLEKISSGQNRSKSSAGWRRIRSETPPLIKMSAEKEFQEDLKLQLIEAINHEQYETALRIIDQIKDESNDAIYGMAMFSEIGKLSLKSHLLKKLGRLEEAYFFITEALAGLPSLNQKMREEYLALHEKTFPGSASEDSYVIDPFMSKAIDRQTAEIEREFLLRRGFIALALNQKELAVADFKKAAHLDCGDDDNYHDPEFLFRTLEKVFGEQIAPIKDYEKEIAALLQENYLYEEERYQLVMYYALLGQHDKALEWYEKIESKSDFPNEAPFLLAYLRGDKESAEKELEKCPDDYKLIINQQILQQF